MKRYIALALCFALIFVSLVFAGSSDSAMAATAQELSDRIDEIDAQIKANKDKLNSLADKKESQQEYLDTLETQISAVEKKADALETQILTIDKEIDGYDKQVKQLKNEITVIEDEITAAKHEISSTQEKIENSKDGLSSQLRSAYVNGKYSTLKILMGSDSLASFLTRIEMMRRMSEEQKRVIEEFTESVQNLNKAKKELVEDKDQLDEKQTAVINAREQSIAKKKELLTKQTEYDKTVSELENSYAKAESFIAELDRSSAVYQSYIKKLEKEREEADKAIEEAIKNYQATSNASSQETTLYAANGNGSSSGGATYSSSDTWGWPLGKISCYISSGYGNRSASISGWSFHGGIDITGGVYGKPVYASRAGTVISAVWGNTGYGNYCVIDHGDGFSTVYAHCSSLSVTKGQYVSKGQQIANVGSTGNSTGPHLHFEVRYKGEKQNPLNYVKKP